jgi:hypothetical protein
MGEERVEERPLHAGNLRADQRIARASRSNDGAASATSRVRAAMHFHLPKPLRGWRKLAGEWGIIGSGRPRLNVRFPPISDVRQIERRSRRFQSAQ